MDVRATATRSNATPTVSNIEPDTLSQQATALLQKHANPETGSLDNSALLQTLRELAAQDEAKCGDLLCELEQQMELTKRSPIEIAGLRRDVQNDPQLNSSLEKSNFHQSMRGMQYIGGAAQVAGGIILAGSTCVQTLGLGCIAAGAVIAKGIDNMQAAYFDRSTVAESYLAEKTGSATTGTIVNAALDLASGRIAPSPKAISDVGQLGKHFVDATLNTATKLGAGYSIAKTHTPAPSN